MTQANYALQRTGRAGYVKTILEVLDQAEAAGHLGNGDS